MAHAFIMDFAEGTLEQYDAVMAEMALDGPPDGLIVHASGHSDGGLHVCDVWERAEDFLAFREAQLGPATAKLGVPVPRVRDFEVAQVREGTPGDIGFVQVVTIAGADQAAFAALDAQALGPENALPEGGVFHVNGGLDGDWIVLDYWTTAAANEAFIAARVAPVFAAAGRPAPVIEAFAAHNTMARAGVTA